MIKNGVVEGKRNPHKSIFILIIVFVCVHWQLFFITQLKLSLRNSKLLFIFVLQQTIVPTAGFKICLFDTNSSWGSVTSCFKLTVLMCHLNIKFVLQKSCKQSKRQFQIYLTFPSTINITCKKINFATNCLHIHWFWDIFVSKI